MIKDKKSIYEPGKRHWLKVVSFWEILYLKDIFFIEEKKGKTKSSISVKMYNRASVVLKLAITLQGGSEKLNNLFLLFSYLIFLNI